MAARGGGGSGGRLGPRPRFDGTARTGCRGAVRGRHQRGPVCCRRRLCSPVHSGTAWGCRRFWGAWNGGGRCARPPATPTGVGRAVSGGGRRAWPATGGTTHVAWFPTEGVVYRTELVAGTADQTRYRRSKSALRPARGDWIVLAHCV
jgi:hypothetical protein